MPKLIKAAVILLFCSLFYSCTEERVYEQNIDLDDNTWSVDNKLNFGFEIEDESKMYQIWINLRYDAVYPYRNLYLLYQLNDSTNASLEKELINIQLFGDKLGEPLGQTNSNIISLQNMIADSVSFPFAGKYQISMEQYMRTDSLKGVYSAGIKIKEFPTDVE